MHKHLDRIVSEVSIAFAFVVLTGFQSVKKATDPISSGVIPKEKKELLNKIVGRWITQANIHARHGRPASKAIASDVWQWSPDGNFLVHTAYGIREKGSFGAIQITGYNSKTGDFDIYNFNQDGSISTETLTICNNIWIWKSKEVRTTGEMDSTCKILSVKHEITEDGKTYELFMEGFLTKCSDF